MQILIVEDDKDTRKSIEMMLGSETIHFYSTELGEEAIDLGKLYQYDIILLDLNLPDMSGFEVLRALRTAKIATPIMILSGVADIDVKIRSFSAGADDYMTKPFHKGELLARIRSLIRRSQGHAQTLIETGDLVLNLEACTVEVAGRPVSLTRKEHSMLELLCLRKGHTVSKDMFLNHLYGGMDEPEMKIIDVFICKLRKKLSDASHGKHYIHTVWGAGYVLREPSGMGADLDAPLLLASARHG